MKRRMISLAVGVAVLGGSYAAAGGTAARARGCPAWGRTVSFNAKVNGDEPPGLGWFWTITGDPSSLVRTSRNQVCGN